ncbi:MAG: hypothetical protein KDA85_17000, partial [Planctomycetaceae bacterium]|nr:hypothetical protein [Planctomycetaceae bacterium]
AIQNHWGTAPGILMTVEIPHRTTGAPHRCTLAAMPGVPAEMKPMFEQMVVPHLPSSGMALHRRVLRTFGYGESDAEHLLGDLTARGRNPEVGITASEAVISLYVSARGETLEACHAMAEQVCQEIHLKLGRAVFAEGDIDLHHVVARDLTSAGRSICCMEGSSTGGLIAQWLSDEPNADAVLRESRVYGNALQGQPAPPPGDGWSEWALTQCQNLRHSSGADFVILTSSAHDETNADSLLIRRGMVAVGGDGLFELRDVSMTGNVAIFRQRAARTALNLVRLALPETGRK